MSLVANVIPDVFFKVHLPVIDPVPVDDYFFRDVFQRVKDRWHGTMEERAFLISQLPDKARNSIYRVIADWGDNKEDLDWAARNCRLQPHVLMGVVMEAYRKRICEQAKRCAVADIQITTLKWMCHLLIQSGDKVLIERVQWNFRELPPLVQLRCLSP